MIFFLPTFTYVCQYTTKNEFTCSEHSVSIRMSKKRSTGNQPLVLLREIKLGFPLFCVLRNGSWFGVFYRDGRLGEH